MRAIKTKAPLIFTKQKVKKLRGGRSQEKVWKIFTFLVLMACLSGDGHPMTLPKSDQDPIQLVSLSFDDSPKNLLCFLQAHKINFRSKN